MSRRYDQKTKSCPTPLSHLNQKEDDKRKLPTNPNSDFQYFMQQFASHFSSIEIQFNLSPTHFSYPFIIIDSVEQHGAQV